MYLESLELSGFKSFAKKTELSFGTSITAIVGPNGSGKSNVAEAFRFVLGEQSIKSMRGKRGEDLIWGGTEQLARANRASVKVVLNNQKRIFPLDFDSISVERVVNRDGENEYLVNGSRVRLKDVQEILASANVGPSGHHIISQGEADRILSASPKERREMIEEALGLKIYQYKKVESEKKLQKTRENIAQVEALRKEVEPHLRFLERQVKKAEKSRELAAKLEAAYAEYLKREELYLAYHEARVKKARSAPEQERAALEKELAVAKETLAKGEQDEKRRALTSFETKLASTRAKREEVMRESGRIEGLLGYLKRSLEDAEKNRAADQKPVPFAEVKRAVGEVTERAAQAPSLEDAGSLRQLIQDMVGTLRSFLETAGSEMAPEVVRMQKEYASLEEEKAETDAALREIAAEESELDREYEIQKAALAAETDENRAAEREVFRIMGRQRELAEELNRLTRDAEMLARDREEWKRELQEAVVLIGRAASQYTEYVRTEDGTKLSELVVVKEDRSVQLERRRSLERMKIRLEELGGSGHEEVLAEHKEVSERDQFLKREIEDLEQSVTKLETLIADLTEELNTQFVSGIEQIGTEFNRFFMLMFGGGSAALVRTKPKVRKKRGELEDIFDTEEAEEEEVEEGIDIDVKLPNKRVRGLEMLSGGERALTSIALIFAMSQVNPPLFVILDETDAALDEANSRRYGDMIESLAKRSQLILITHNRETMSRAGVLYGVTMGGEGVSKLLSVKFEEAVKVAK